MRRPPHGPSRLGSFLLVLGFLTVLAVSFGAGVGAGRRWPRLLPSLGSAPVARADRQDAERAPGRLVGARGGPGAALPGERPAPELTFYHELTAPLAAPPPAAKPRAERLERSAKVEPPKSAAFAAALDQRFTVQVGAYKTREQAQAVQSRLASAGHDAYIAELDGSPGARFRVRVGTFATRDEARLAAERLGAEQKTATFVTTR
jgi:septal ring-binding cell division protein DamX